MNNDKRTDKIIKKLSKFKKSTNIKFIFLLNIKAKKELIFFKSWY